jgi:hypothetical protein
MDDDQGDRPRCTLATEEKHDLNDAFELARKETENRNAVAAITAQVDERVRAIVRENWAKTLVAALDSATRSDLSEFSSPGTVGMTRSNFQDRFEYRNEGPHFIVEAHTLLAFARAGDEPSPGEVKYDAGGVRRRPTGFVLEIGLSRKDIEWEVWSPVSYSLDTTTKRDFDVSADAIWSVIVEAAKLLGTQYAREGIDFSRAA